MTRNSNDQSASLRVGAPPRGSADTPAAVLRDHTTAAATGSGRAVSLDFLDGLRGLAALYVALGHVCVTARHAGPAGEPWPGWLVAFVKASDLGHYAVAVFIVLSGYCLMLPVARSAEGSLRGGVGGYLVRRARRILPPYYAALALTLALLAVYGAMPGAEARMGWDPAASLHVGPILSHLALVHNLFPGWVQTINGPMWSVALEWQIYFLFPALLLPVWRRAGRLAAVAAGLGLGLLPHFALPHAYNLDWTFPWYVGLFALGMAAADLTFSRRPAAQAVRRSAALGPFTLALWLVTLGLLYGRLSWMWGHLWVSDPLVGLAAATLILYCARGAADGAALPAVGRLLNARPFVALGAFSYSLYLVHLPLMNMALTVVRLGSLPPAARIALSLGVLLPLLVACAYLFHMAFEKPFMPQHWRKQKGTA